MLDHKYDVLRDAINENIGYRILDDEDTIRIGDETKCASLILSTQFDEPWHVVDDVDWAGYPGKPVSWANDGKACGDMDASERLFRRKVSP